MAAAVGSLVLELPHSSAKNLASVKEGFRDLFRSS